MAPAPAPAGVAARPRARLIDLIALVLVAGAALAVARGVREASRGPRGEDAIVLPTLVALGLWVGVVLVEGIASRSRPGPRRRRGLAWRLVALTALAVISFAAVELLRRYQADRIARFRIVRQQVGEKLDPSSPQFRQWLGVYWRGRDAAAFHYNVLILGCLLVVALLGVLLATRGRRSSGRGSEASVSRRPAAAGWAFVGIMLGAPIVVGLAIARFGSERWIEGFQGAGRLTWRGKAAPWASLGAIAWIGAAEVIGRDLQSRVVARSRRGIAYRLLALSAAIVAAVAAVSALPFDLPWRAPTAWDQPLDGPRVAWFGLTAAILAAGLAARAAAPAEPRPAPAAFRVARRLLVAIVALAVIVLAVAAWEDEMWTIRDFWPTLWRSEGFSRVVLAIHQVVHGGFRACLWGAALAYLATGVVGLLGPRRPRANTGGATRLADLAPWAFCGVGPVVVAAVVAPYLVEALQFDEHLRGGLSLVGDLLDRLNTAAGAMLSAIDVELVFLAPGAYWILSRHLDGFAPPEPSPLDFALADGPTARRFAADWASLFVLLASAPPIAFAGFVILLG